ncbi:MAG: right-handed parallel beta-helix repeat-containing protein [Thermoplasmata archaeon]|nr:right-handed parallel beta-helix repeat-containing protein [Thermoplasmata archaeon]
MKLRSKTTKGMAYQSARGNFQENRHGLTNGFQSGDLNGCRTGTVKGRSYGKVCIGVLFTVVAVGVAAVLTLQGSSTGPIKIDGMFDDWHGVDKTTKARDTRLPENIHIAEDATVETGKNVAFYAKVYGNLLAGDGRYIVEVPSENPVYVANQRETAIPNANGRDVAYVFVDIDNNPSSGFRPSANFAVGADRAIEVIGKNGKIEASRVLLFAGVVQQEWTWNIGESVAAATNGKQLETMAGKGVLGATERYAVYFYMIDWQNKECGVDSALQTENARSSVSGLYPNAKTDSWSVVAAMNPKGTPHAPIHINGNADFANQVATEGWPGDGTENNPYIIEGYDIDGASGSYCIWIENTTCYFTIRNCALQGATAIGVAPFGAAIALSNVQNGKIENNICTGSIRGVYIYGGSAKTAVLNNTANANSQHGIALYYLDDHTILNNTATGNAHGIYLYSSRNGTVAFCTANSNSASGLYLGSSDNLTVTSNNANSNTYGISLSSTSNTTIDANTVSGNNYGIYLSMSHWNTITSNTGYNNYDGAFIQFSNYNNISSNNFSGNYYYGLVLYTSTNHAVMMNTVSNNSENGIYLMYYSNSNTFTENNVSGNSNGICLHRSTNNNISLNWFYNNKKHGVSVTDMSTSNHIIHNNFIGNNGATRGANGNCQAYDEVGGNYWHDNVAKEGNYWSNWDGNGWGSAGAYPIEGGAGAYDMYPVVELSGLAAIGSGLLALSSICGIAGRRRE